LEGLVFFSDKMKTSDTARQRVGRYVR